MTNDGCLGRVPETCEKYPLEHAIHVVAPANSEKPADLSDPRTGQYYSKAM